MSNIGIVVIATNAYFVLGVRFIKKFMHHYKGDNNITFYFFSDTDPKSYLPDNIDVEFIYETHSNWQDGTNSKFKNIISLENCKSEYLYYFDADTSVSRDFNGDWFIGELVGGEHYGNRSWLANCQGFDRNPISKAYVPEDTNLPCTYYYGAFFGGKKEKVIEFCKILREWQLEDKKIPYEPGVNDESYINAYFHYNPPQIVTCENFRFEISHKGGIGETRDTSLSIDTLKEKMLLHKDDIYDIINGKIGNIIRKDKKDLTLVEYFNLKGYSYYPTDKNTAHSYLDTYEELFRNYKDLDFTFLEVGVREGGSIRLWGDYFTKAKIYGYDIVNTAMPNIFNERTKYIVQDINTITDEEIANLDITIALDDGSHMLNDQLNFVKRFYPYIKEGGMIIVEDIQNIDTDKIHFEKLGIPFEIIDLRSIKGRYDDVIFLFKK